MEEKQLLFIGEAPEIYEVVGRPMRQHIVGTMPHRVGDVLIWNDRGIQISGAFGAELYADKNAFAKAYAAHLP